MTTTTARGFEVPKNLVSIASFFPIFAVASIDVQLRFQYCKHTTL